MNADNDIFPNRRGLFQIFLTTGFLSVVYPLFDRHLKSAIDALSTKLLERSINFRGEKDAMRTLFNEIVTIVHKHDQGLALPALANFVLLRKCFLDWLMAEFTRKYLFFQLDPKLMDIKCHRVPENLNPDDPRAEEHEKFVLDDAIAAGPEDMIALVDLYFNCPKKSLYCEKLMSKRVTLAEFTDWVKLVATTANEAEQMAADMGQKTPTIVAFIDEFNTTYTLLGSIKEIFCDKTYFGRPLPNNIFWVCAMNLFQPPLPTITITITITIVDIEKSNC